MTPMAAWRAIVGWNLAFESILAFQSDRTDSLWILLLWVPAAVGSFEIFAIAVHKASVLLDRTLNSLELG